MPRRCQDDSDSDCDEPEQLPAAPAPKRGRGRPRKDPQQQSQPRGPAALDASRVGDGEVFTSSRSRKAVQRLAVDHKPTHQYKLQSHEREEEEVAPAPAEGEEGGSAGKGMDRPNNEFAKRLRERQRPSKVLRANLRAAKKQAELDRLEAWAQDEFIDFSWLERRKLALARFSVARQDGFSCQRGYEEAAKCARVSERTAADWIRDYCDNDGFFTVSNWGAHAKIVSVFDDPEVKLKSIQWWNAHQPKKGEPNARVVDFKCWLLGDTDAPTLDGKTGPLTHRLEAAQKADISEEQVRKFVHHLGFAHEDLKKGSFNDEHNSEANIADRNTRFIPQYFKYHEQGPHQVQLAGEQIECDLLEDLTLSSCSFAVTDRGGVIRQIDFPGELPQGKVYLLSSHDESCAKAGEMETKGWRPVGSYSCIDKSQGPSVHSAKFGVEFGNGTICMEPNKPPPQPVTLQQLRSYISQKRAGEQPTPLCTADVIMNPGKNAEGYWGSEEAWMQFELAMDIFEYVFPPTDDHQFVFVACVDWSQGHAAMPIGALSAETMNNTPGGKQPHLTHTFWPRSINGIPLNIPRWNLCADGCLECKAAFDAHGTNPDFQSIGRKGLKQVLLERGLYRHGMQQAQMIAKLQECGDFAVKSLIDRAHLTQMMADRGHVCLFGAKYHAELAWIERKWMLEKREMRPYLNGKRDKLHQLLARAHTKFTVLDARKAARHCRETMRAYLSLSVADDAEFAALKEAEKKYKGHRRVFDSVTCKLVERAGATLSAHEKAMARRTEVARTLREAKAAYMKQCEVDWKSRNRRKARARLTLEELALVNNKSKQRKITAAFKKRRPAQ